MSNPSQVIATAGHVDHGKSALVRALTGMEPDRWAEERRRGMTIDLGYVWSVLPSGTEVAFVDVPGHERFVPNMLAGVGAVPAVLFVVAADEGWRAQSQEHLEALVAFGVKHVVLAITRCDLRDGGPAAEEARARLQKAGIEPCGVVETSARTMAGLGALRAALDTLVASLPVARGDGAVRLWVDRVFTIRGAGTVVTGTLGMGSVGVGDELMLAGDKSTFRIRGIESLKRARERVEPVSRVALNLRGGSIARLQRGSALVTPGSWLDVQEADVRADGDVRRLAATLVLHVGTAAVSVHVRPLGRDTARVRLGEPLPLRPGDRALLRDPGLHRIVAGLMVLDVRPPALARRAGAVRRGEELVALGGPLDAEQEVQRRGAVRIADLRAMGAEEAPSDVVTAAGWYVAVRRWQEWCEHLDRLVRAYQEEHPLDAGLPLQSTTPLLGLPDARLASAVLAATSSVGVRAGRLVPLATQAVIPPQVTQAVAALAARLAHHPFAAPEGADLPALGLHPPVLAAAARHDLVLVLADGVCVLPKAVDDARTCLKRLPQPFTTSQARQAFGTTRRVAIPLLEHLDRLGVTRRVDSALRILVQR